MADAVVARLVEAWLRQFAVDEEGLLVNAIAAAVESDPALLRVADVAARFGLTERTLARLVRRRIGFAPKWLIVRRRLQDAAVVGLAPGAYRAAVGVRCTGPSIGA